MNANRLKFTDSKRFKKIVKEDGQVHGLRKQYISKDIKQEGGDDSRIFRFTISTNRVDRDRDTVNPEGFDLENFKNSPSVLFAHDNSRPPIGRAPEIEVEDGSLKASVEFMDNDIDTSGFSDMIFRMVKNGFIKATSVGFLPLEFDFADGADEKRAGGIDFHKQELLEFSVVPVPSNPDALIEARSKGIDTSPLQGWFEEALDDWINYRDMILVPRKTVESLHKASSGKSSPKIFHLSNNQQDSLRIKNLTTALESKVKSGEDIGDLGSKLLQAVEQAGEDGSHIKELIEQAAEKGESMETKDIVLPDEFENQLGILKDTEEKPLGGNLPYDDEEEDDEDEDKSNNSTPHDEDDEDPNAMPPKRDDDANAHKGEGDDEDDEEEEEDKANNETPHEEDDPLDPNATPNENSDANEHKGGGDMDEDEDEDEDEEKGNGEDFVVLFDEESKEPEQAVEKSAQTGVVKGTVLPKYATRIFNTPLAISQGKLNTILYVLGDKLGLDKAQLEELDDVDVDAEARDDKNYVVSEDGVATIPIMGTLVQRSMGMNALSGLKSYDQIEIDFLKALDDPEVKAIALHIDSPGGEVAGCFDLVDTIYEARGQKPIWSIVDEQACSAAYAIASAADKIYAPRTADVGSIGVVTLHADFSRAYAKEGIEFTFIHAGDRKVDGNPYERLSSEAKDRIQKDIDNCYDIFIETVSRNRGLDSEVVKSTEALTYLGSEAVDKGLADSVTSARKAFYKLAHLAKGAITKEEKDENFEVQSFLFPKAHWKSADEASEWLSANGFEAKEMRENDAEFSFEVAERGDFGSLRTVCFEPNTLSADDNECKVQALGGEMVEKQKNANNLVMKVDASELSDFTNTMKDFIAEMKDLHSLKNSGHTENQVEEPEDRQEEIDQTEKLVAEMLPEVLPEIIKDVLGKELRKAKGKVD